MPNQGSQIPSGQAGSQQQQAEEQEDQEEQETAQHGGTTVDGMPIQPVKNPVRSTGPATPMPTGIWIGGLYPTAGMWGSQMLSSISPGQIVWLSGLQLGATQGSGYVQLSDAGTNWGGPGDAASLQILNWSDQSINFVLPSPSGPNNEWALQGNTNLTITVTNDSGATSNPIEVAVVGGQIWTVTPLSGLVPMFGQAGTQVSILGANFDPGTTVTFGNSPPVTPTISSGGDSLTAVVPPTATSGPLVVTTPVGNASNPPGFAVDSYRNTRGFSFENSKQFQSLVGATYSFADATALFGESQTTYDVIGVNVLGPVVDLFLAIVDLCLDSGGQCFGFSLSSLRFTAEQIPLSSFPQMPTSDQEPSGPVGPDTWILNGPQLTDGNNISPLLSALIHQQHMAQFSQESINNWVSFHVGSGAVTTAADLRNAILQAFTAGGESGMGAIVTLNPSISEGHAVVAYELVDTGAGNFDILVYNPNVPFEVAEDSDAGLPASRLEQSTISVMSDGSWTASLDVEGEPWSGGIFNLTVLPWNAIPFPPTFPYAEVILAGALAAAVLWIVTGDAQISQVTDRDGHFLLTSGQWNVDPTTMLTGVRPMPAFGGLSQSTPAFVSNGPEALTHTITGAANGTYEFNWIGAGYAVTMTNVPVSPGGSDLVETSRGAVQITPAADKELQLTLTGRSSASSMPRTATLRTTVSAGTPIALSFNPAAESFDYVHGAANASYQLELSSFDQNGNPTTFTPAPASVSTGMTLTFRPDWQQLPSGQGTLGIRDPSGVQTSHPLSLP